MTKLSCKHATALLFCVVCIIAYTLTSKTLKTNEQVDPLSEFYQRHPIYKTRIDRLRNACKKTKNYSESHLSDSKRFVTYRYGENWFACIQPKSGTTNWQKALIRAASNESSTHENAVDSKNIYKVLPRLSDLNYKYRYKKITSTRYKILVVRHPIQRLFSAWRDKFNKSSSDFWHTEKKYLSKIKLNKLVPDGMGCSFSDFIKYFLENKGIEKLNDHHWKSLEYQCDPCGVEYGIIALQESMDSDVGIILGEVFGGDNSSGFGVGQVSKMYDTHVSSDSRYFDLDENVLERLNSHFRRDYEMFGYSPLDRVGI